MKTPSPLDVRCPACDARTGERCSEGVTHPARHALVNRRVAGRRHEPTADERERVAAEQEQIRQTLAGMKYRGIPR